MADTTFDAGAVDLATYGAMSNLPLVRKIVFSIHKTMNALQDIPLRTIRTYRRIGVRYISNLPQTNWVPLGQVPITTVGKPVPYDEQMFYVRNKVQMDVELTSDINQIENPLDSQLKAWTEGFSYNFNTVFIQNGHPGNALNSVDTAVNDPNAPLGLRARLDFTTDPIQASCKVFAGITPGTSLANISAAGLTQATANSFITYVDTVMYLMNNPTGENMVIYLDYNLHLRWQAAVRILGAGGGFSMVKDAFDRSIDVYKSAKLRLTGFRAQQQNPVLCIEDVNGNDIAFASQSSTSPGYQSMYFVTYDEDSFAGWQPTGLQPKNLGPDPTNDVIHNIVINWGIGLWNPHNRAIGRLFGVQVQ